MSVVNTPDIVLMDNVPATIKVMIVEDHPAVREALANRIARQKDMTLSCEAGDFADALQLATSARADVAVIDLTLRGGHGLDLIKRIRNHTVTLRMLVWSMHPESLYAERALQAGALGYVSKDHGTERVVEAIRTVMDGKVFLSEAMSQRLLANGASTPVVRNTLDTLSDRELETFELLGQGLNTNQVASKMRLSPKTVETFRARIKDKLKLRTGSELLQRAMQWIMENRSN